MLRGRETAPFPYFLEKVMQIRIKLNTLSTSKGIMKNGDIVDLPKAEVDKILAFRGFAIELLPELDIPKEEPKPTPVKRTRKKTDAKLIN